MTNHDKGLQTRTSRGYFFLGAGLLCAIAVTLAGCSGSSPISKKKDPFAGVGSPVWSDAKGPMPKGGGRRHLGKPYQVADLWFHPKHEPGYDRKGVASWYGPKFNRRMTSNGEWFDMEQLTAAHTTMELPSYAKVTNLENGQEVIVRVNDRGPFVDDRIIDMSKKAADVMGFRRQGKAKARVQYIGPAPLKDPDYGHLAAMNQELLRRTPLNEMIASANLRDGRYGDDAPTEQAAATINTASSGGAYYVQVAAFSDVDNAQRTKNQLADIGGVVVDEASGAYGQLYRVRLGPLSNQQEAQSALAAVRQRGHHDAVVRASNY
ncbi:MAG: septal ring lytic transglycosylase RlpA family protein [Anderseniella sp.]